MYLPWSFKGGRGLGFSMEERISIAPAPFNFTPGLLSPATSNKKARTFRPGLYTITFPGWVWRCHLFTPKGTTQDFSKPPFRFLIHHHLPGHRAAIGRTACRLPHAAPRSVVSAMEVIGPRGGKNVGLTGGSPHVYASAGSIVEIEGMQPRTRQLDGVPPMCREAQDPTPTV